MTALLAIILGACRGPLVDLHREGGLTPAAVAVCAEVAVKAHRAGRSPAWLARLAYRESRLRADVCSPVGACGPLQAVPRYWCPNYPASPDGCDLVAAGVRAWAYYLRKARGDRARALCWYTGRRCA